MTEKIRGTVKWFNGAPRSADVLAVERTVEKV